MTAWHLCLSESIHVLLIVRALLCAIGSLEGRGYLHVAETTEIVLHIFGKLWLWIAKLHATRNTTFFLTAQGEGFDHYWALPWVQYVETGSSDVVDIRISIAHRLIALTINDPEVYCLVFDGLCIVQAFS